jgi:hypothetical protein
MYNMPLQVSYAAATADASVCGDTLYRLSTGGPIKASMLTVSSSLGRESPRSNDGTRLRGKFPQSVRYESASMPVA